MEDIKVVSIHSNKEKVFAANKPYKEGKKEYFEYLVSVDLEPGEYSLGRIEGEGLAGGGFLIAGHFGFPVNARFTLSSGITYLGHVKMTNRERKEGEQRSGGIFPLIDQTVCGFSGGTFDVTVSDRSETDIPAFIEAYPRLKDVNITKAIMQK